MFERGVLWLNASMIMENSLQKFPEDFTDYWQSDQHARAMRAMGWSLVGSPGSFGYVKRLGIATFSKFINTDTEPDISMLRKAGSRHGFVYWSRWRDGLDSGPERRSWKKVPQSLWLHCLGIGWSRLEPDYRRFWSQRARRSLNMFSSSGVEIREGTKEEYSQCFSRSTLSSFARATAEEKMKYAGYYAPVWLIATLGTNIVGGLSVVEYGSTSLHFLSCLTHEGRGLSAGIGLIDYWHSSSLAKRLHYVHFGFLAQEDEAEEYRGFSDFKRNFVQHEAITPAPRWGVY